MMVLPYEYDHTRAARRGRGGVRLLYKLRMILLRLVSCRNPIYLDHQLLDLNC